MCSLGCAQTSSIWKVWQDLRKLLFLKFYIHFFLTIQNEQKINCFALTRDSLTNASFIAGMAKELSAYIIWGRNWFIKKEYQSLCVQRGLSLPLLTNTIPDALHEAKGINFILIVLRNICIGIQHKYLHRRLNARKKNQVSDEVQNSHYALV